MSTPPPIRPWRGPNAVELALLSESCLFRDIALDAVNDFLARAGEVTLPEGDVLLTPGEPNTRMYILMSGRLRVHLDDPHSPPLLVIEPGECVGELSLIDSGGVSAFVVADQPSRLLVLEREVVWGLISASHEVSRNLLYMLSQRVRLDNLKLRDSLETQARWRRYAFIDALTGLHNRLWFDDTAPRQLGRSAGDGVRLCLGILDVDHFKQYNDSFGHQAGDRALEVLGKVLGERLRPTDLVARYGGEEFVFLLPDTDAGVALDIAERLRSAVAAEPVLDLAGVPLPGVTISVGIAEYRTGDTVATLMGRADQALYLAKKGGRDQVRKAP